MSIYFNGKNHKNIVYQGKNHKALYKGNTLIWTKENLINLYDPTVVDLQAYIQYATKAFKNSSSANNLLTYANVEASSTYVVEMLMDNRFRVAAYNGIPPDGTVLANYVFDATDLNDDTVNGTVRRLEIKTGTDDNKLLIGYWTSTGSMTAADIRNTIKIYKKSGV